MLPTKSEIAARAPQVQHLGTIRAVDFQRFALAVGDMNPIYFDDQAARAAGYPGIVAPPTYLASVRVWGTGPSEAELRADGTEAENYPEELQGWRVVGGGFELSFGQAPRPGDEVTATRRLIDIHERPARAGRLLFVITDIVYVNQHGVHLVTCRETVIGVK